MAMTAEEKEDITQTMIIIMRAIKQVMTDGVPTTLHFGDAEITIKKTQPQPSEASE